MKNNNQDFEKYAKIKPFNKNVSQNWIQVFRKSCKLSKKHPSQIKILDFGCGDGKYFKAFKKCGIIEKNIYGVEVSKTRINRCRSNGMKNVFHLNRTSKIPFKARFFDIVNMMEVIEHIPQNKSSFILNEISRVLKNKGMLLISTPNYPIKRFYDFYEVIKNKRYSRLWDDPTHVTKYNYKKLKMVLASNFKYIIRQNFKNGFLHKYLNRKFLLHKILFLCKKK